MKKLEKENEIGVRRVNSIEELLIRGENEEKARQILLNYYYNNNDKLKHEILDSARTIKHFLLFKDFLAFESSNDWLSLIKNRAIKQLVNLDSNYWRKIHRVLYKEDIIQKRDVMEIISGRIDTCENVIADLNKKMRTTRQQLKKLRFNGFANLKTVIETARAIPL